MGCEISNKKIKKNKHFKKLNKSIDSFTSSDVSMDESYLKVKKIKKFKLKKRKKFSKLKDQILYSSFNLSLNLNNNNNNNHNLNLYFSLLNYLKENNFNEQFNFCDELMKIDKKENNFILHTKLFKKKNNDIKELETSLENKFSLNSEKNNSENEKNFNIINNNHKNEIKNNNYKNFLKNKIKNKKNGKSKNRRKRKKKRNVVPTDYKIEESENILMKTRSREYSL